MGQETLYSLCYADIRRGDCFHATYRTLSGRLQSETVRAHLRRYGDVVPWTSEPWRSWWSANAISEQASAIDTPLLFNVTHTEAMGAMELYVRLREQGVPTEMYLYPDAYHLKWRPLQVLASKNGVWLGWTTGCATWRWKTHPILIASPAGARSEGLLQRRGKRSDASNPRPATAPPRGETLPSPPGRRDPLRASRDRVSLFASFPLDRNERRKARFLSRAR